MNGATDVQLRVTMDASQARAEVQNLHREMQRRFRKPTASDAYALMWDRMTGMPPNPYNPSLPYEPTRHSGIWWANQAGIKGLGSQQYRHQFFTEREARYMGMQFAKAARKELVAGAKSFAVSMGLLAMNEGMSSYFAWQQMPGINNRATRRQESTWGGMVSGGMQGVGAAGALIMALSAIGAPLTGGASLLLGGAALAGGAAIGGAGAYTRATASERNEDIDARLALDNRDKMRRWGRSMSVSDMAFGRQMEMMPSRRDKLNQIERQLMMLSHGGGSLSLNNLRGMRQAMVEGGEWRGVKYEKGDLNTQRGQWVETMLQRQESRYDALKLQQQQLQMTPYATPRDAITDSYSRRGMFVGAQVDTISFNREIIANIKKIVESLEALRKGDGSSRKIFDLEGPMRTSAAIYR